MSKSKDYLINYLLQSRIVVNDECADPKRELKDGDFVTLISIARGGLQSEPLKICSKRKTFLN